MFVCVYVLCMREREGREKSETCYVGRTLAFVLFGVERQRCVCVCVCVDTVCERESVCVSLC